MVNKLARHYLIVFHVYKKKNTPNSMGKGSDRWGLQAIYTEMISTILDSWMYTSSRLLSISLV